MMKKRAFLFGINDYNGVLNPLKYARQDAEGVARALKKYYQFEENEVELVTCETNFKPNTKFDILRGLKKWSEPLDLLLVGFWGHGVWREGKRYLCPIATDVEHMKETALTLAELRDAIRKIPAKNVCVILDCCQSRSEGRNGESLPLETGARDIVMELFNPTSSSSSGDSAAQTIAILNSCSEGERAYEWDEKAHGFFTHHLLEAFERAEPRVTNIFSYVQEETRKSAALEQKKQKPFFECMGGAEIFLPAVPKQTFFVPENPNEVSIVTTHDIGQINVQIQQIDVVEGTQPQALPPVPPSLRKIQAEILGIDQAIEQLQAGTHSALDPAKKTIADARSQLSALEKKRDEASKDLGEAKRAEIRLAVRKNPEASASSFFALCPKSVPLPTFSNIILWEKLLFQAQREVDRVEAECEKRRDDKIQSLRVRKEEHIQGARPEMDAFCNNILQAVLSTCRDYDQLDAPVPEWDLNAKLPELFKYGMGWKYEDLWRSAEAIWVAKRPVVVAARQEEREKRHLESKRLVRKQRKLEKETRGLRRKLRNKCRIQIFRSYVFWILVFPGSIWGLYCLSEGFVIPIVSAPFLLLIVVPIAISREDSARTQMATQFQKITAVDGITRKEIVVANEKFAFCWCPPGDLAAAMDPKSPDEEIFSRGFWMLESQVTQRMWQCVMGYNPSYFHGENRPVECVSWYDCVKFCEKLSELAGIKFQLPTEAQWVYACSVGQRERVVATWDSFAWHSGNSFGHTHGVKKKKPNDWGLFDMYGNVREWCADRHESGMLLLDDTPRASCGGAWSDSPSKCSLFSTQESAPPATRNNKIGFRIIFVYS
ncbi:MAG: SUMF1/EgtB/PvdO family nonheme iron enzyme [Planctomycetia bacterium]|nr:SUMF1/EgtB/PvdO family nonheme iron enzyme [Planctomycetia bacterium]